MAVPGNKICQGRKNPSAGANAAKDAEQLRRIMDKGWPVKERIAATQKQAELAAAGNTQAYWRLMSYAYGKPKQQVDVAGESGGPLVIKFVYDDDPDPAQEAP
jgi:hypothetical protein